MIHDVDTSVAGWLADLLPGVAVSFDPPAAEPPSSRKAARPMLLLFLSGLHQESDGSTSGWSSLRDEEGVVVGRVPGIRYFRFTYLLMGQAKDTATEHQILGRALEATALYELVPQAFLAGALAELDGSSVRVRLAPSSRGVDTRELWHAWGVPPRTVLELTVLAPLPLTTVADVAAPPSQVDLGVGRGTPPATANAGAPPRRRPTGRISE